ncbi:MAG: hypothetical protein CR979_01805, partial [Propionibacterium sp.]
VRNGEFLDPGSALLFNQDDQLFLAVPAKLVEKTQQSLFTLSRDGRPSRWRMPAEQLRKLYGSLSE